MEKKTSEKLRASAAVDSTRVKQVDSSLAFQKSQAANQVSTDSLNRSTETAANNNSVQKDSSADPLKSEAVTGKAPVATGQSAMAKKENADREAILKDSLDKGGGEGNGSKRRCDLKGADGAKDAAAKDAAAKDAGRMRQKMLL